MEKMFEEATRQYKKELLENCSNRYYEGYSCYIGDFVKFCGEKQDSFLYKFLWYVNTPGLWLFAFNEATKSWLYHQTIKRSDLNHFFTYYSNRYAKDNGVVNPYENQVEVENLTDKAIEYIKQIVNEETIKMTK